MIDQLISCPERPDTDSGYYCPRFCEAVDFCSYTFRHSVLASVDLQIKLTPIWRTKRLAGWEKIDEGALAFFHGEIFFFPNTFAFL